MMSLMSDSPSYHDLKRECDALLERIQQLEAELDNLRRQLSGIETEIQVAKASVVTLSLDEKVALFWSLFRGREDVFARRWQSRTSGKSGYQPVCVNEWNPDLCDKRKYKCAECPNRQFAPLTDTDIYRHLEGKSVDCRDVVGLYVIREDNTCHFLCADFDDKNCEHDYENDVVHECLSYNGSQSAETPLSFYPSVDKREQQIGDESGPNLCLDGVYALTVKIA